MNIKETKEMVDGLLSVVTLVKSANADGKIDIMDLGLVLGVIPAIQPAIDGAKLIPGELAHIDAQDAADLVAHVMAKLAINDAKAVSVINEALKTAKQISDLVKAIKA